MRVGIAGMGTLAPGWSTWPEARAVLRGEAPYDASAMPQPVPHLLQAAERRRASVAVRWTQAPAAEALAQAGLDAAATAAVFASSSGNPEIVHQVCEALARPERDVSPTRFHNSVHNTAAGYWAIATGARASSTSVACYDGSFAAGLLEAVVQVVTEACPVLLVAYDVQYPQPLHDVRPLFGPFTVALALVPTQGPARYPAALRVATVPHDPQRAPLQNADLERLHCGNPAARSLSLLEALAQEREAALVLEYVPGCSLALEVAPC
jgi:hypothetical protein